LVFECRFIGEYLWLAEVNERVDGNLDSGKGLVRDVYGVSDSVCCYLLYGNGDVGSIMVGLVGLLGIGYSRM